MAILLHKIIADSTYDLYLKIAFSNNPITEPDTGKLYYDIIVLGYQSEQHYKEGFKDILRRVERLYSSDEHPIPFECTNSEQCDDVFKYINEYITTNIDWYKGGTLIDGIGMDFDYRPLMAIGDEVVEEDISSPKPESSPGAPTEFVSSTQE